MLVKTKKILPLLPILIAVFAGAVQLLGGAFVWHDFIIRAERASHIIHYSCDLCDSFKFLIITYGILLIATVVFMCVFLFRLWRLAQSSYLPIRNPSPGEAIRCCFIPFFNFYWIFILYRNLALHLNSLTQYNRIPVGFVTIGVALALSSSLLTFMNQIFCIPQLIGTIIVLITNFSFHRSYNELYYK